MVEAAGDVDRTGEAVGRLGGLVRGQPARVEPQFRPRDVLVSRRAADISRALEVLGWKPTIDLVTGMQDLVDSEIG